MDQSELSCFSRVLWNILEKNHMDPAPIFQKAGLDPALMYSPGARYNLKQTEILWQEADRGLKDPCFALAAPQCWHPSHFSTLGYTLLASKTIRNVFELSIRFISVVSGLSFAEIQDDTRKNKMIASITPGTQYDFPHRMTAILSIVLQVIRTNFQTTVAPVKVTFTHSAPPCLNQFYAFFQCPVYFDSTVNSIQFSLDIVDNRLPGGSSYLVGLGTQLLMQELVKIGQSKLITDVKSCIVNNLPSGHVNLEHIAKDMRRSSRTLQRMLKIESTSFQTLLDETRKFLAMQYVQNRELDITEIAFLLGFSDQSSLSRAFKRWTGKSPIQFRNEESITP